MSENRKNVKLSPETYNRAQSAKRDGETWDGFLRRALNSLEGVAPNWDTSDEPRDADVSHVGVSSDIPEDDDVLTTEHIDDIAAATARKAADEVEARLR